MLLNALYRYATEKRLLNRLPFQLRKVHWLLPIAASGEVRGDGFVPLSTPVTQKGRTKEEPGRELLLPRFPGENNGGKAYYLAEAFNCVLGVRKDAGETLPVPWKSRSDRNPVESHNHFWQRIADAAARTDDVRLKAVLAFHARYLSPIDGAIARFSWLEWRPNESSRDKKEEWHGRSATGEWKPVTKFNTITFDLDGHGPLVVPEVAWADDPLWRDWATAYRKEAFAEPEAAGSTGPRKTICLVTGEVGKPVARSHKPKILGIPGLASGGYVVSFAKESPAFSSFGFDMGANAPVSEDAAAAYALGLQDLLDNDDTHFSVGGVTFCFWAEKNPAAVSQRGRMLNSAKPAVVKDFLKSPFAGVERQVAKKDAFLSVALSANAGRVVVREWLRVPLDEAIDHLRQWFADLEIVALGEGKNDDSEKAGPYSLFRLAAACVRESGELDRISDTVTGLYRNAWAGTAPNLRLLEPLLAEFRSALVTDTKKKPTYPFGQSRFALLKLILLRHERERSPNRPSEDESVKPTLCETDDAAYNLGRLLCVLAALQDAAHEYALEGPGVVERYYGSASTAPANVFGVLWKLHVHHLRKLEQHGKAAAAAAIRGRLADIVATFPAAGPNQPPRFPQTLTLEEQGRFALGFYQQMAADKQAIRDSKIKNPTTD